MIRALTVVVLALLLSGCEQAPEPVATAGSAAPAETQTYVVSAIPDENPTELQRKFQPLVDHLEKALGAKVSYVPVTDYGAAVTALAAGKVDFAWLGGFTHVQARHQAEVVPLCMRDVDREFKSVFFAAADAGIEKMEDLKGKSFAFGSKSSTSGHLMPRHFLTTQFSLNPEEDFAGAPVYSGSHDATIKMVESGKVHAGAANMLVWERLEREKTIDSAKVKVFWTTPGYVDYVWTARKAVPEDVRKKFTDAFLSLDMSKPDDAKVLQLQDAKKFVPASPSDFDAVEKVALSTGLLKEK
jgi:phosphonate transport system substrate-binding protein